MAEKKLVFQVEVIGSEAGIKKLAAVEFELKAVAEAMKEAKKAGDQASFERLAVQQEKLKQTAQGLKNEIREQNRVFEASKYPLDSLRALEVQYGQITKEIRNMSHAERQAAAGQALIAKAKELKDHINKTSQSFGDTSKNIGNYTQSIQRALENPIKFLKNAGIAGIIATVGIQLTRMGTAAVEAFGKTEAGAKKLEPVKLGFERLKAVGREFIFGILEKILPVIEKVLPPITSALSKTLAFISGIVAAGRALGQNVVNEIKIMVNGAEILFQKTKAFFGDETAKQRIKELQEENKKLEAGVVTVADAFNSAFDASIKRSEAAVKSAKLETKEKKDWVTALEALKKKEQEVQKVIEDRSAKGLDITKELRIQENLLTRIKTIEDSIALATAKTLQQRLKIREASLQNVLETSDVGSEKYKEAAFELAKLRIEAEKLAKEEEELQFQAEQRAKGYVRDRIQDLNQIPRTVIVEIVPELLKNTEDITNSKEQLRALKSVTEASDKLRKEQRDKEMKHIEDVEDAKKQALADTAEVALQLGTELLLRQLDMERENVEKQRDIKLEGLNKEYDKKKAFAAGNNELLVRLEYERAQKEEKINKEAAKKQQTIAIKQAIINAAAAAIKTLASLPPPFNFLALIPLAAATAAQIALIKSQKFAKGGFTQFKNLAIPFEENMKSFHESIFKTGGFSGPGGARDETGERVAGIGVYHGGEYVAPKIQVRKYPELFRALDSERAGGSVPSAVAMLSGQRFKKLAEGGFTTPVLAAPGNGGISIKGVTANMTDDQILFMAKTLAITTARETGAAVAANIADANRRAEREERFRANQSK